MARERNKFSKELRALALRYFSFTEEYRARRTESYMEWSIMLKDEIEHLEEMLNTMRKCDGFSRLATPIQPKNISDVHSHVRRYLNAYSSEALFQSLKDAALREAQWESKYGTVPNAEAAAWLAYFTDWDPNKPRDYNQKGGHVPNQNWHSYYKDHFGSSVDEEAKPKRSTRKPKKP